MDIQIYSDGVGYVPFTQWLEALADRQGRAAIKARLLRLEAGNFGDCKALRDGVLELRIDKGRCWCCCCVAVTKPTKTAP